jgi:hypothetical protein
MLVLWVFPCAGLEEFYGAFAGADNHVASVAIFDELYEHSSPRFSLVEIELPLNLKKAVSCLAVQKPVDDIAVGVAVVTDKAELHGE